MANINTKERDKGMISKQDLKDFINNRIDDSKYFLDCNNTSYEEVLNSEDTGDFCEESENNNFEAGIISVLLELKKEFDLE